MVYRGKVHNGQIVLESGARLAEGTEVEVVPATSATSSDKPRRGSLEAILPSAGIWHGEDEEIDRLLAELKEMKKAEVERQLREPEPEL